MSYATPVSAVDDSVIDRAVEVLRAGGLVAIPTETVYGLAADASSAEAVEQVFKVKGRPAGHPLIVHIAAAGELARWARDVPAEAASLIEAFWPGPLTVVLPRQPSVPLAVTGGLDTVAVRMPSHPVTRRILDSFGGGIAAPSANRFGRVSPTTAEDVVADLGSLVDLVVDGGPCAIGVESTVIEVGPRGGNAPGSSNVTVLRPGGIGAEMLEAVLGSPVNETSTGPARAPGMLASHYAPRTPLVLCEELKVVDRVTELTASGYRVGVLSLGKLDGCQADMIRDAGGDIDRLARSLYGWLREADAESLDVLLAVPPGSEGLGTAIRDRLTRAARR